MGTEAILITKLFNGKNIYLAKKWEEKFFRDSFSKIIGRDICFRKIYFISYCFILVKIYQMIFFLLIQITFFYTTIGPSTFLITMPFVWIKTYLTRNFTTLRFLLLLLGQ